MNDKVKPIVMQQSPAKKPNENVGFRFSSAVTIKDPETNKVLVQLRCS
jgi:hypothetical protein